MQPLVDRHVVYIIQQLETRRADQTNDFSAHLGGSEEVADVVGGDVQRLEVEVDLFLLGQLSAASSVSYIEHSFTVWDRLS